MKAAVFHEPHQPLTIENVEHAPLKRREVLVRTAYAGLCHSDLHFIEGLYPFPAPCVLGHEAAGVVEAVGEDVTYVKPGDHVISCLSVFCGECPQCMTGHPNLCENTEVKLLPGAARRLTWKGEVLNQFANLSAFAEHMLVHEHALVKVRDDVPLDRCALVGCGVITGVGAVFHTAKVEPGATVAVIGCGGIGLNAIQAAALVGAGRIIAVDRLASKLAMARTFGATDVVDGSSDDPVLAVQELTGGGVDHAFEAIGLKVTAEQAFAMLGKGGVATVIGMVPVGQRLEIDATQLIGGKRLQGSNMGSNRFRVDMPQYVDWYLAGKLKLDELVSATMPLDKINDGFATLASGQVARQLILFD